VRLTVDHVNTNMKTDFGDIRFNTDTGNYIPYWIEKQVNDISADVWIKTDLANGNTIIYMYYSNQSLVGVINVTDTFIREISGVVGAWDLNGDALDRSGQGNNGTLIGGMGYVAGKFAGQQAGYFDGTDDKVSIPDSSLWTLSGDFSFSLWFNLASLTQDAEHISAFIGHDEGGGPTNKWIFSHGPSSDRTYFHVNSPSSNPNFVVNSNLWYLTANSWNHVAFTRSGTTYKTYLNNVDIGSVTQAGTIPDANTPLTIGYGEGDGGFFGTIGNVHIYNKTLSQSEIADIYNNFGYVTTNYTGKELIRKYTATEPTYTTSAEQTLTATHMSIVPRESPCRVGICIVDVHVTWTNTGESVTFTPSITVDGTTHSLAPRALPIDDTIIDFEVSGMNAATHTICPDPN
jgi:Concanavalin A-like lectin/glucanases superfamily/Domain of unknown function (DUF2341)